MTMFSLLHAVLLATAAPVVAVDDDLDIDDGLTHLLHEGTTDNEETAGLPGANLQEMPLDELDVTMRASDGSEQGTATTAAAPTYEHEPPISRAGSSSSDESVRTLTPADLASAPPSRKGSIGELEPSIASDDLEALRIDATEASADELAPPEDGPINGALAALEEENFGLRQRLAERDNELQDQAGRFWHQ